jgi:hypothetical protein
MATNLMTMSPCDAAQAGGLERTRFFARQLITADDLTQDQEYFREKHRRHNRMLHGWGIVCGACVRRGNGVCEVIVEPGYILGPYGDEIVIDREVTIDLCTQGSRERDGCCGEAVDPWCGDVRSDCPDGTVYLAVRYSDCRSRPVRVGGGCGCGCDDESQCEYSRTRDSFSLRVLRDLPTTYATPMPQPTVAALIPCRNRVARRCTPCPEEPWVILADIAVGRDCRVRSVDCFAHRRYVVSFADFYLTCRGQTSIPTGVTSVRPELEMVRAVSPILGTSHLVDVRSALGAESPRASVGMRRADGTIVTVPAHFEVRDGDTIGDLIEREGDRTLYDPVMDTTISLRDLYEKAGVSRSVRVTGAASALAPLEGMTLGEGAPPTPAGETEAQPSAVAESGPSRYELEHLLDKRAMERLDREYEGNPAGAADFPATDLAGVAATSTLGRLISTMTIAAVANLSREEFVAGVVEAAPAKRREELEKQATKVWRAARAVLRGR